MIRIEPADDRLDRVHDLAHLTQVPDQRGGDKGFPDIGSGRGDEDRGQGQCLSTCVRTSCASRAMSPSSCCAVKAKRKRAVPAGTVGGRIATTRKPLSRRIFDAASAAPLAPTITGTIALSASGRLRAPVNSLALRNGSAA